MNAVQINYTKAYANYTASTELVVSEDPETRRTLRKQYGQQIDNARNLLKDAENALLMWACERMLKSFPSHAADIKEAHITAIENTNYRIRKILVEAAAKLN